MSSIVVFSLIHSLVSVTVSYSSSHDDMYHHAVQYTQSGQPYHSSADDIRWVQMQRLYCQRYGDICDRMLINDMAYKDSFLYLAISAYVIDRLDDLMAYDLVQNLNEIRINPEFGTRSRCERNNRWCATHHYITLNLWGIASSEEYMQVLTHELCHVIDLGVLEGTRSTKNTDFTEFGKIVFAEDDPSLSFYRLSRDNENDQKASARERDFFSEYGQTNPFEDFAESCNGYLNHRAYFERIASSSPILQAKYDFFEALFGEGLFLSNKQYPESITYRVRDSTTM